MRHTGQPVSADRVDILIPTKDRPAALAVTLSGLAAQTVGGFRVIVSDQSERAPVWHSGEVRGAIRILDHRGSSVDLGAHRPPRGMAEQRAHLLGRSGAPYVLFLDDDVWLEPTALERLCLAMGELRCGFVGAAVQGLSHIRDVRPHEHVAYEEWKDGVLPECVRRGEPEWDRWRLHNAANLLHIARDNGLHGLDWRAYKVAWAGGCVLYDRQKLVECGGFDFWERMPADHAGEDVAAQLRVMERYGGAGIIPSGAFHLEVPTTVADREAECYDYVFGQYAPNEDEQPSSR
jgi:glycosyltransferase involved in cell wall biosynthesis